MAGLPEWSIPALEALIQETHKYNNVLDPVFGLANIPEFKELAYMNIANALQPIRPGTTADEIKSRLEEEFQAKVMLELWKSENNEHAQQTPFQTANNNAGIESLILNHPSTSSATQQPIGVEPQVALASDSVREKPKSARRANPLGVLKPIETCLVNQFRLISDKSLSKHVRLTLQTSLIEMLKAEFKKIENEENDN